jgi:FAD/FMN-containing dehydrogenase
MAAITAMKRPDDYWDMKGALPPWMLFLNIVGYDYLPEERVDYQVKDMMEITQRIGLKPVKTIAKTSAYELLKTIQHPSEEPYWKLRPKGACYDIFFLTIYDKLDELIGTMRNVADACGYPTSDIGIYLQPIVQGTSCHCEFNFFYDPENPRESRRVKDLSAVAIRKLADHGAFFSRPYGETARTIINRDAATTGALFKIKAMFDPNNIMNPGKLCF